MFGSLYDFAKGVGKKIFTSDAEAAMDIQRHIESNNPGVSPLHVEFDDGCVTLRGFADSPAAREECILLAGNVEGVEKVVADMLDTRKPKAPAAASSEPAAANKEPAADSEPAASNQSQASANEPSAEAAPEESRFYEIQKGDTLWAIASKAYGNGARYTEIVDANPNVIDNPDRIYPGQKIRIP
ncbi:MAG: LysM peptidoglycan-binding domain-containing protein [Pseudomonadaceae bacterium]|nr:LysM peptidoglycan-binding domain-containing protein [Pseudomonadaceae bacterium]